MFFFFHFPDNFLYLKRGNWWPTHVFGNEKYTVKPGMNMIGVKGYISPSHGNCSENISMISCTFTIILLSTCNTIFSYIRFWIFYPNFSLLVEFCPTNNCVSRDHEACRGPETWLCFERKTNIRHFLIISIKETLNLAKCHLIYFPAKAKIFDCSRKVTNKKI